VGVDVGALIQEEIYQIFVAFLGRTIEGCIALVGFLIDMGTILNEQFGKQEVPHADCAVEWAGAVSIVEIDIGTPGNEQGGDFIVALTGGVKEGRSSPAIGAAHIGALAEMLLHLLKITFNGCVVYG
jgi:hypothetical protein